MQAEINLGGELKITPTTETEKYAILQFMDSVKPPRIWLIGDTMFIGKSNEPEVLPK